MGECLDGKKIEFINNSFYNIIFYSYISVHCGEQSMTS
jgi:hypothetical protein